jgi:hypothetical protein
MRRDVRRDSAKRVDAALWDFLQRRLKAERAGEVLDLRATRARVDEAMSRGAGDELRAALVDEAVAAVQVVRRVPLERGRPT